MTEHNTVHDVDSHEALLAGRPELTTRLILELTDSCNLRCRYCHQSMPEFTATRVMTSELFDAVVDHLRRYPEAVVDLTGAGDLTAAPDWCARCKRLLDLGVRLATTVNLARLLTPDEVETLSKVSWLNVSIDCLDIDVLRSLRRSADARTIVYNLMAVRTAQILRSDGQARRLSILAVLSADAVTHLDRLAAFGSAVGADSLGIRDLVEYPTIDENAASIWSLDGGAARKAVSTVRAAIDLASRHGLTLDVPPNFSARLDALERRADTGARTVERVTTPDGTGGTGGRVTYVESVPAGFTRDCTDPWTFVQILGDGAVRPCCFSEWSIGRLDRTTTLERVLDGDVARRIRGQLLRGELDQYCAICPLRGQIEIGALKAKIQRRIDMASASRTA
ncbi:MAG TPA: radical SAM protein [Vicinamibacterales bacterium]|jgi:MoaA/NifB/PqqE/SkfB family radical SAM enzyme